MTPNDLAAEAVWRNKQHLKNQRVSGREPRSLRAALAILAIAGATASVILGLVITCFAQSLARQ